MSLFTIYTIHTVNIEKVEYTEKVKKGKLVLCDSLKITRMSSLIEANPL